MRIATTIAGSDSGGGAGIQADLKTFQRFGVFGTSALTMVTAQNTLGVSTIHLLPPEVLLAQLDALAQDLRPHAVKTGALGSVATVAAVAEAVERHALSPLVVDPVLISKHGAPLAGPEVVEALGSLLLPHASLLTPNLHEAGLLVGGSLTTEADMREAARALASRGTGAVLVKGGSLPGEEAVDVLYDGQEWTRLVGPRHITQHTHGTGCSFSAAITAGLAQGLPLREAVGRAKRWIGRAIATAPGLGSGAGPIDHDQDPDGA